MLTFALLAQIAVAAPADSSAIPLAVHPDPVVFPTWTPHRVFDTRTSQWTGLEELAAGLVDVDVVLFGEQHDDAGTHAMQRALLESLSRRRPVVLSLEMFERDVQQQLDDYLAGHIGEDSLLATSRPWPNYATDYRPAVEWARVNGWPVIAANIPRPIASAIARGGVAVLDTLGARRGLAAEELQCGAGAYFDRFAETMREHVPGDTEEARTASLQRYYESQCLKDETMAESIVRARATYGDTLIVHLNGAFHSDYALGTAERVARRNPSLRIAVISALPVSDLDAAVPSDQDLTLGQWLIYTLRP